MSQPSNPLIASETIEAKYRKALAQIQKIHNANRVLKTESQATKVEWDRKQKAMTDTIHRLQLKNRQLEQENNSLREIKIKMETFLEELQMSNSELRKEQVSLQREVALLNDSLAQQNTELKKVATLRSQKGLAGLFASYQERELVYRKDIGRQEELIRTYNDSIQHLQNELAEERKQRFKFEDMSSNLRAEVGKYKQLNTGLLSKHEAVLSAMIQKSMDGKEKYREAETVLAEIGRQLQQVRSSRIEQENMQHNTVSVDLYDKLLNDKRKMQDEVLKLQAKIKSNEIRQKEILSVEEQLKLANLKIEHMQEQSNMFRSKLVVLQTKNIMIQHDEDQIKETNQKLPPTIKNSADITHFQIMKEYIIQTKQKLNKALLDKKQYEKKYRYVKEKINEKIERTIILEQQQKILQGKLQGFQRLTEKLQFQLQRSLETNDEELAKMKNATNQVLARQAEETKNTVAYIRAEMNARQEIFQRNQKQMQQEINNLQSNLTTAKLKIGNLSDEYQQANEFLAIYKAKFQQLQAKNSQLHEAQAILSQNALRFEQLYRQQRTKNELVDSQKQSLNAKLVHIREQMEKRTQQEGAAKQRETGYESELIKLRAELVQVRSEAAQLHNSLKVANQLEDNRLTISGAARSEGSYHASLEQNYQQERLRNKVLESQLTSLRQKADKVSEQAHRAASLEDALSAKNDELNDLKRRTIGFEKQVSMLQSEMKGIRNEYDTLKRENAILKKRLKDSGQEMRKSFMAREEEEQRSSLRISEQLVAANIELREEKRATAKMQVELQSAKKQLQRTEQLLQQGRRKEAARAQQLNTLRITYESVCQENARIKSELKYQSSIQQELESKARTAHDRINRLSQESNESRSKFQSLDNDYSSLMRELGGLKIYLAQIESFARTRNPNAGWQEQRDRENLSNFIERFKKMLRTTGHIHTHQNSPQRYQMSNFALQYPPSLDHSRTTQEQPHIREHHDYVKYYDQIYTPLESKPNETFQPTSYMVNSDAEEQAFHYRDYLQ